MRGKRNRFQFKNQEMCHQLIGILSFKVHNQASLFASAPCSISMTIRQGLANKGIQQMIHL